jgi:hypothetical protein
MHARTALLLVAALAFVGACKNSSDKPPAAKSASGSGSAVAPRVAGIEIFVNDAVITKVTLAQLKSRPRLDTIVPLEARRLGTWETIELVGPKPQTIKQPSATYPDLVPALFFGEGGPSFGMFDPVELARNGNPSVRGDGVTEVRIRTAAGKGRGENEHGGGGGGGDPTKLELKIKTKKGEQVLSGEKLIAMTREAPPGEVDTHAGWRLLTVLEQLGIKGPKRMLLTGESGTNLTLEKQDLDPATAVPFLKLNRQGTIRFRVFRKQGETWQMGSDLRGLTAIEVLE